MAATVTAFFGCQREVGLRRLGPLDEQPDRWIRQQAIGRSRPIRFLGQRKWLYRNFVLSTEPQPGPARHQNGELAAVGQPMRQERRHRKEMFEVIEHQQEGTIDQMILHGRIGRPATELGDAKGPRDGGCNQIGIAHIRQRHEGQSIGKVAGAILGGAKRQPGLAHSSRAGERDQAHAGALQEIADRRPFALPADEGSQGQRERIERLPERAGRTPQRHGFLVWVHSRLALRHRKAPVRWFESLQLGGGSRLCQVER